MKYKDYVRKYKRLWEQATELPRVEAIKKLEECSELKKRYLKTRAKQP